MQLLEQEDLRFLTVCGAHLPAGQVYTGGRNKPVLVHGDDSTITMKEARDHGGFLSQVVYESAFLFDAARVEEAIQRTFQHLPLGTRRLWRHVAMGPSSNKSDVNETRVYKVFITYSMQVCPNVRDQVWMINH